MHSWAILSKVCASTMFVHHKILHNGQTILLEHEIQINQCIFIDILDSRTQACTVNNTTHTKIHNSLYPEWPHRQCVFLAFRRSHVRGSLSAASLMICSSHCRQYVEFRGYCPVYGGGATSQLDLPSLTPFSVAGCGRLQLEAPIGLLQ